MSDGLACKPPRDKTPSVRPGRAATSLAVMWPSQKEEEVSVQEALAEGNECFCVCVCTRMCVHMCMCMSMPGSMSAQGGVSGFSGDLLYTHYAHLRGTFLSFFSFLIYESMITFTGNLENTEQSHI